MRSGNDKTLADRFVEGDESAFIEVYNRYWDRLFLSAYRRTKNEQVAEELVQDLFLKLWEKRSTFGIVQLENYLYSSIRNATIDYLNREILKGKYIAHYHTYRSLARNTTQEMVELHDLEEALEKGLGEISGKSEKIFRLYRIDHWSVEKIARHFNISEKAVQYHLAQSQKFIRQYLQEFTLSLLILLA
jgi:RNA polymerase sigma-70 factor (ECF subfamily)